MIPCKTVVLILCSVIVLCKCDEVKSERREFHGYLPPEENKIPEYQVYPYPSYNYAFKEDPDCGRNQMMSLLGKGLNLLLLKLGVFGIMKAVMALVLVGMLAKLPLLLLKMTMFKSFFFPFLIAPLLLHLFTNQMTQSGEGSMDQNKPGEMSAEMPAMQEVMNEMTMDMGRQLNDNLTSVAWESMKMFAESDQCLEKISCLIGASSKDSAVGSVFARMLKYLHYSSPSSMQKRMTLIKEAFGQGIRTSTCSPEDFKCESPELVLQYGLKKIKIL